MSLRSWWARRQTEWRLSRARAAVLHTPPSPALRFVARRIEYEELRAVEAAGGPELPPYAGLAGVWHAYADPVRPDYPALLAAVAADRGVPVRSVLDLACGTGALAARFALAGCDAVGIDASEAMIEVARERSGPTFARGDFRRFDLGRRFDAVVCSSDSLNYVENVGELVDVFRCVARHLSPGGLFAFDVITPRRCAALNGLYAHLETAGVRYVLAFRFDAGRRRETDRVVWPGGIEVHRRVPIDRDDVSLAAADAGLEVAELFGHGARDGGNLFAVLRAPEGSHHPPLLPAAKPSYNHRV